MKQTVHAIHNKKAYLKINIKRGTNGKCMHCLLPGASILSGSHTIPPHLLMRNKAGLYQRTETAIRCVKSGKVTAGCGGENV